jgi:phosphoribosylaminoimidazole-succinocarboxamide synthase
MLEPLFETNLPDVPLLARGKVRDIYDLGDKLLIVATDRISAFDVVMPQPIPDKGRVLTQMTLFWFELLKDTVEHHLIAADISQYPRELLPYSEQIAGRSMIVKRAEVVPVECVVRGYAVLGSASFKEYHERGTVSGIRLPANLREAEQLPEPIFTPTTKAQPPFHDENVTLTQAAEIIGEAALNEIRARSLAVYRRASEYARERGIVIADTKFEFGRYEDRLILIDEVLTPDSSRFWPADEYEVGRTQKSFDKQPLRDWLTGIGWDRKPPAPGLPAEVVSGTSARYREAYRLLTGRVLPTLEG